MVGGGALYTPFPPFVFLSIAKKSLSNSYLKVLDFKYFLRMPLYKKQNISFTPSLGTLYYGSVKSPISYRVEIQIAHIVSLNGCRTFVTRTFVTRTFVTRTFVTWTYVTTFL